MEACSVLEDWVLLEATTYTSNEELMLCLLPYIDIIILFDAFRNILACVLFISVSSLALDTE